MAYVSRGWNAERRLIGEEKVEAIWEGPASTNKNGELEATKPKGALLALHGCHHSAKDFFANNTKCTECRGLAQEMVITRTALNKGYVVIAISSFGTCWSKDIDAPRVKAVLDVFFNDTALSHLPLYAFGASSGGSFVGMLPQLELKQKLSGLIIQIAPGPPWRARQNWRRILLPCSRTCLEMNARRSSWRRRFKNSARRASASPSLDSNRAPLRMDSFIRIALGKSARTRARRFARRFARSTC